MEMSASWDSRTKEMNWLTGAFSWPMIYVRAVIIPRVILPSMTALAAR